MVEKAVEGPEMCSSCTGMLQEMEAAKREQTLTLKMIKEKIMSTDKLIKKYQHKCDDFDKKSRECDELNIKFEASQRNEELLRAQLDKSLQSTEPLNKNIKRLIQDKFTAEGRINDLQQENAKLENLVTELRHLISSKEEKESSLILEQQVQAQEIQKDKKTITKTLDELKKAKEDIKKEKGLARLKSRELGVANRKAAKSEILIRTLKDEIKVLKKDLKQANRCTSNLTAFEGGDQYTRRPRQRQSSARNRLPTSALQASGPSKDDGKTASSILNEFTLLAQYPVLSPLPPSPGHFSDDDQEPINSNSSASSGNESSDAESDVSSIGDLGELLEVQLRKNEDEFGGNRLQESSTTHEDSGIVIEKVSTGHACIESDGNVSMEDVDENIDDSLASGKTFELMTNSVDCDEESRSKKKYVDCLDRRESCSPVNKDSEHLNPKEGMTVSLSGHNARNSVAIDRKARPRGRPRKKRNAKCSSKMNLSAKQRDGKNLNQSDDETRLLSSDKKGDKNINHSPLPKDYSQDSMVKTKSSESGFVIETSTLSSSSTEEEICNDVPEKHFLRSRTKKMDNYCSTATKCKTSGSTVESERAKRHTVIKSPCSRRNDNPIMASTMIHITRSKAMQPQSHYSDGQDNDDTNNNNTIICLPKKETLTQELPPTSREDCSKLPLNAETSTNGSPSMDVGGLCTNSMQSHTNIESKLAINDTTNSEYRSQNTMVDTFMCDVNPYHCSASTKTDPHIEPPSKGINDHDDNNEETYELETPTEHCAQSDLTDHCGDPTQSDSSIQVKLQAKNTTKCEGGITKGSEDKCSAEIPVEGKIQSDADTVCSGLVSSTSKHPVTPDAGSFVITDSKKIHRVEPPGVDSAHSTIRPNEQYTVTRMQSEDSSRVESDAECVTKVNTLRTDSNQGETKPKNDCKERCSSSKATDSFNSQKGEEQEKQNDRTEVPRMTPIGNFTHEANNCAMDANKANTKAETKLLEKSAIISTSKIEDNASANSLDGLEAITGDLQQRRSSESIVTVRHCKDKSKTSSGNISGDGKVENVTPVRKSKRLINRKQSQINSKQGKTDHVMIGDDFTMKGSKSEMRKELILDSGLRTKQINRKDNLVSEQTPKVTEQTPLVLDVSLPSTSGHVPLETTDCRPNKLQSTLPTITSTNSFGTEPDSDDKINDIVERSDLQVEVIEEEDYVSSSDINENTILSDSIRLEDDCLVGLLGTYEMICQEDSSFSSSPIDVPSNDSLEPSMLVGGTSAASPSFGDLPISVALNDEECVFPEPFPLLSPLPPSPPPSPVSSTHLSPPLSPLSPSSSPRHSPPSLPLSSMSFRVQRGFDSSANVNLKRNSQQVEVEGSTQKKMKSEQAERLIEHEVSSSDEFPDYQSVTSRGINRKAKKKEKQKMKMRDSITTRPSLMSEKSYCLKILKRIFEDDVKTEDIIKRLSNVRGLSSGLPFALAIVQFQYAEDFMPQIIQRYSERTRTDEWRCDESLIPAYERRVVELIQMLSQYPHLKVLPTITINHLSRTVVAPGPNTSADKRAVASFCRLVTALCGQVGDLAHVRVLCYNILRMLHMSPGTKVYLMISIAGVWPAVLTSPTPPWLVKNGVLHLIGPPYQPFTVTLQMVLSVWIRDSERALLGPILDWLCRWTPAPPVKLPLKQVASELSRLMADNTYASLDKDKDGHPVLGYGVFESIKCLELIALTQGWEWSNNVLIGNVIWGILKTWKSELHAPEGCATGSQEGVSEGRVSEATVVAAVRLLGMVCRLTIQQSQPVIPTVIDLLIGLLSIAPAIYSIQLAAAHSLLDVSPWRPETICKVLEQWTTSQPGQRTLPPSLTQEVHCLRLALRS